MRFHLADDGDSAEIATVLSELRADGPVSDLQRALANSPGALRVYLTMSRHVRHETALDNDLRELVILRVQQHLRGEYEWRRHVRAALQVGVTETQVRQLPHWESASVYSERQRAGLCLADACLRREGIGAAMDAVARQFSRAAAVELCLLIGFYLLGGALILPFDLISGDTLEAGPLPMPAGEDQQAVDQQAGASGAAAAP